MWLWLLEGVSSPEPSVLWKGSLTFDKLWTKLAALDDIRKPAECELEALRGREEQERHREDAAT